MQLLHIDSSISGGQSVSRQLSASIVARLIQTTPNLEVTYRDIAAAPVPHHSEALQNLKIQAVSKGDSPANPAPNTQLARDFKTLNEVLDEFVAADIVVLGTPMYNFGIPSQLKAWIDCLAAPGRTFRYTATGVEGLCAGKRIIIASSRGGVYSAPSPMAALEHQESYLTDFFGFMGVNNIEFVRAEGVSLGAEQRQRALESALAEAAALQPA